MKAFKTNHILYTILILSFLTISLLSLLIPTTSPWFTLVSGLGCGGFASVLIAWLVDIATCKTNNKKAQFYQQEIFCELISSFETGVQPFILLCEDLDESSKNQSKTWNEWIKFAYKISQRQNYERSFISYFIVFEQNIFKNIKILDSQKPYLLQNGIIDENDNNAISGILSLCSCIDSEHTLLGSSDAFFKTLIRDTKVLYHYLGKSSAMKQINTIEIKSILNSEK